MKRSTLRLIRNDYRPDMLRDAGLGDPPRELPDAERRCWEEVRRLSEPGVLCEMDRHGVELLCYMAVRIRSGEYRTKTDRLRFMRLARKFYLDGAELLARLEQE